LAKVAASEMPEPQDIHAGVKEKGGYSEDYGISIHQSQSIIL